MPMQPAALPMPTWSRTKLQCVMLGKRRGAGAELQLSSNAEIADIGTNGCGLGEKPCPRPKGRSSST